MPSRPKMSQHLNDYCHMCNEMREQLVDISYKDDRDPGVDNYIRACTVCIGLMHDVANTPPDVKRSSTAVYDEYDERVRIEKEKKAKKDKENTG